MAQPLSFVRSAIKAKSVPLVKQNADRRHKIIGQPQHEKADGRHPPPAIEAPWSEGWISLPPYRPV
jgi:hypothetical protein